MCVQSKNAESCQVGPLSPRNGVSSGNGWRRRPLDMQDSRRQLTNCGPPVLRLSGELTISHCKELACCKTPEKLDGVFITN
jgi:hypothetical protein